MSINNSPIDCIAVVLAAGKGTRMRSELPKVATNLLGKPLIAHVLENLYQAGLRRFCIVVGYKREVVKDIVSKFDGVEIQYAVQEEQNGTAHAFLSASQIVSDFTGPVLVASGDMPALQPSSFRQLIEQHIKLKNSVTVLSAHLDEPGSYGRLVRDDDGNLLKIVEQKDASADELQVQEVNTGTYVFESPQVFTDLTRIGSNNAQNEYYLPDMISLYQTEGKNVGSVKLDHSIEAQGVNSPEELSELSRTIKKLAV